MDTSKCAEKMLVAVVKEYDKFPGLLSEPGCGLDAWDLAVKAGIISKEDAESRRTYFFGGGISDNIFVAAHLMQEREWVEMLDSGEYGKHSPVLFPTANGIDHGHHLSRPFWQKFLDSIKGDIRTIVIALITAVLIAIVTTFLMNWIIKN